MEKAINMKLVDILAIGAGVSGACGTTDVFYSESFPTRDVTYAFGYKFTSAGTVKVKVELEQGKDLPATEGAADAGWCVPNDALEFDNECADEILHIKAYAPSSAPYSRIKITGLSTNDASTVIDTLWMSMAK
jgi:hypothetical protein